MLESTAGNGARSWSVLDSVTRDLKAELVNGSMMTTNR